MSDWIELQVKYLHWPDETAINNTAHNGEVPPEMTYRIGETLYRKNPAGAYALYFAGTGRGWRESACVTNQMLERE
jgi:hypothetical protein